jgi:hypothetical protein
MGCGTVLYNVEMTSLFSFLAKLLRTSLNWELRRKYYGDHYGDYGGNYGDLCGGPDLPDRLAGRGLIQNPLGLTYYMFICIILLHN